MRRRHQRIVVKQLSGRGAIKSERVPAPCPSVPPLLCIPSAAAGRGIITLPLARPYSLIFAAYCCFYLEAVGEIPSIKFITCYLAGPNVIFASFAFIPLGLVGPGWSADWLVWKNRQASKAKLSFTSKQGQPVKRASISNDVIMDDVHKN